MKLNVILWAVNPPLCVLVHNLEHLEFDLVSRSRYIYSIARSLSNLNSLHADFHSFKEIRTDLDSLLLSSLYITLSLSNLNSLHADFHSLREIRTDLDSLLPFPAYVTLSLSNLNSLHANFHSIRTDLDSLLPFSLYTARSLSTLNSLFTDLTNLFDLVTLLPTSSKINLENQSIDFLVVLSFNRDSSLMPLKEIYFQLLKISLNTMNDSWISFSITFADVSNYTSFISSYIGKVINFHTRDVTGVYRVRARKATFTLSFIHSLVRLQRTQASLIHSRTIKADVRLRLQALIHPVNHVRLRSQSLIMPRSIPMHDGLVSDDSDDEKPRFNKFMSESEFKVEIDRQNRRFYRKYKENKALERTGAWVDFGDRVPDEEDAGLEEGERRMVEEAAAAAASAGDVVAADAAPDNIAAAADPDFVAPPPPQRRVLLPTPFLEYEPPPPGYDWKGMKLHDPPLETLRSRDPSPAHSVASSVASSTSASIVSSIKEPVAAEEAAAADIEGAAAADIEEAVDAGIEQAVDDAIEDADATAAALAVAPRELTEEDRRLALPPPLQTSSPRRSKKKDRQFGGGGGAAISQGVRGNDLVKNSVTPPKPLTEEERKE